MGVAPSTVRPTVSALAPVRRVRSGGAGEVDHAWIDVHSGVGYETVNGLGLGASYRLGLTGAL